MSLSAADFWRSSSSSAPSLRMLAGASVPIRSYFCRTSLIVRLFLAISLSVSRDDAADALDAGGDAPGRALEAAAVEAAADRLELARGALGLGADLPELLPRLLGPAAQVGDISREGGLDGHRSASFQRPETLCVFAVLFLAMQLVEREPHPGNGPAVYVVRRDALERAREPDAVAPPGVGSAGASSPPGR